MRLYPTPAAPHTHIWHHRARYAKPLWGPLDVWVQNRMQTHRHLHLSALISHALCSLDQLSFVPRPLKLLILRSSLIRPSTPRPPQGREQTLGRRSRLEQPQSPK